MDAPLRRLFSPRDRSNSPFPSRRRRNRAGASNAGRAPDAAAPAMLLSSPDCPAVFTNPKGIHETVLAAADGRPRAPMFQAQKDQEEIRPPRPRAVIADEPWQLD